MFYLLADLKSDQKACSVDACALPSAEQASVLDGTDDAWASVLDAWANIKPYEPHRRPLGCRGTLFGCMSIRVFLTWRPSGSSPSRLYHLFWMRECACRILEHTCWMSVHQFFWVPERGIVGSASVRLLLFVGSLGASPAFVKPFQDID